MPQTTEGAGPAIAAHSKDASTLGQNPASEATGDATSLHEARNTAERSFQQVVEFVRTQPPLSMAMFFAAGLVAAKVLGRR
jgi:hypothetical protein